VIIVIGVEVMFSGRFVTSGIQGNERGRIRIERKKRINRKRDIQREIERKRKNSDRDQQREDGETER